MHNFSLEEVFFVESQEEDEETDVLLGFDEIVDEAENQAEVRYYVDQADVLFGDHFCFCGISFWISE